MRFFSPTFALAALALLPLMVSGQSNPDPTPPQPGQLAHPTQNKFEDMSNTLSAPPLTVKQKFNARIVQSFGLRGLGGAAIGAAIGQARNSPHEWGQGAEGFGRRYGSGFAGNLSRQTFAFALESALHEDPRYFPSTEKTKKARIGNALRQVIICKKDDGQPQFAYGRVFSAFGAAQFTNIWQPRSTGSVSDGFVRAVIGLGGDAAFNVMQEFLPFTRSKALRHHR